MAPPAGVSSLSPEATKLQALVEELEATLAACDTQLSDQCRVAAEEEGKVIERRLGSELANAISRGEQLEQAAAKRAEDSAARNEQLARAERRLAEAEEREQRLREQADKRKAHQVRLRQLEAEHRVHGEKLHSDLRRARDRGDEAASQLRRALTREQQECERISERNAAAEATGEMVDPLRSQLEACHRKMSRLEESVATAQEAVGERLAEVDDLVSQSSKLEQVAEQRDEDVQLQTELAASEDRVQEIARRSTQLRQADSIAEGMQTQLRASSQLVSDMETAILQAQAQVDASELPDEPPETWAQDKERLKAQLDAMRQAEEEATEHASRLAQELADLQNQARPPARAQISKEPSWQVELEHARAQLDQIQADDKQVRAALDAKGRRLQMLIQQTSKVDAMAAARRSDAAASSRLIEGQIAAKERQADKLKAMVVDLGSQLDMAEKEVQQLRQDKEERCHSAHSADGSLIPGKDRQVHGDHTAELRFTNGQGPVRAVVCRPAGWHLRAGEAE